MAAEEPRAAGAESIYPRLLVTGEMALAVVLLAGAGVMIRSYLKIHTADIGAEYGQCAGRIGESAI